MVRVDIDCLRVTVSELSLWAHSFGGGSVNCVLICLLWQSKISKNTQYVSKNSNLSTKERTYGRFALHETAYYSTFASEVAPKH